MWMWCGVAWRVDEVGCADRDACEQTCQLAAGCTNIAYPLLVIRLLPAGARGLMLAVMMSALMSSLTSVFNSSSTIFTVDVWTRLRPHANDVEIMIVSRSVPAFIIHHISSIFSILFCCRLMVKRSRPAVATKADRTPCDIAAERCLEYQCLAWVFTFTVSKWSRLLLPICFFAVGG